MKDENYIARLEGIIRQVLAPVKDIPFNLVIETLTSRKVFPFDEQNPVHAGMLAALEKAASDAAANIKSEGGMKKARPNEVGNEIERFVRDALGHNGLSPETPRGSSGRAKSSGYPDLKFSWNGTPFYLECKTYSPKNTDSSYRSFFFSPSTDFKVIEDAVHLLLSYETEKRKGAWFARHYKIISLEYLSLDLKHEFNSNNTRLYSNQHGARTLAEADC
ncbi:MAG: hypothetical protein LBI02_08210 [Opitutaceae bacterium]|jgi:hypothetical protein|nr:hypothetical protein [Opitutaceae bacterium]